jgi:coatomer protein complex subunit epsilon
LALQLHTLLSIDRVDLAGKTLKKMQEINDDNVLTQLCTASVNLSLGTDKIQEAYYIYQEMIDKHGSTPLLCNGIAAAMFCSSRVSDAESFVQQALDKNSDQPETVINFMFLAHQQGK